ncbi:hypothetical protein E0494_02335 [Marinilabiliaceae bacterium JC040]|nr:hypothetical protein [Marinilabiliaceae bacterium JC040]
MKKDTLINVITNEIDEIKKICHDINNNDLEDYLVELAIDKTNTLRKELYLLQKAIKHPNLENQNKNQTISFKENISKQEEVPSNVNFKSEKNNIVPETIKIETEEIPTIKEEISATIVEEKPKEIIFEEKSIVKEEIKNTKEIKDINSQIKINNPTKQNNFNNNQETIVPNIGINDKFLFIRELFNGDNTDYKSTINKIVNNPISKNEICKNRKWNLEDETVDLFFKLLNIE